MITASTPTTSRPHARGYRDRATAATIAPRTWDIPTPDLAGLHLDRPGNHHVERTADAAMVAAVLLFVAGSLWLTVPRMTPAFLFTWAVFVGAYVVGRVAWDRIRHY